MIVDLVAPVIQIKKYQDLEIHTVNIPPSSLIEEAFTILRPLTILRIKE
jgi:hypothetical protein